MPPTSTEYGPNWQRPPEGEKPGGFYTVKPADHQPAAVRELVKVGSLRTQPFVNPEPDADECHRRLDSLYRQQEIIDEVVAYLKQRLLDLGEPPYQPRHRAPEPETPPAARD